MKKLLLVTLALTACFSSMEARRAVRPETAKGSRFEATVSADATKSIIKAPARANEDATEYTLGFCGDLYSWYRFSDDSNVTYRCFLYIDEQVATQLAGNQITAINICPLVQSRLRTTGTVFVTEDITADPVSSTTISITKGNVNNPSIKTFNLDEPYTIKAGVPFFFGYTVEKCNSNDYPVAVDGGPANTYAGFVEFTSGDTTEGPYSMIDEGLNLFMYATTVGSSAGLTDLADYQYSLLGDFNLPTIAANESVPVYAFFSNNGDNPITSVDYTITQEGGKTVTATATGNIDPKSVGYIALEGPTLTAGRSLIDVTVHKFNSVDVPDNLITLPALVVPADNMFDRKFVVEEFTGTWCGYCPLGIVGLDEMSKDYPDNFIGIAIHDDDDFPCESYQDLLYYCDGYPSCLINRDLNWMDSPQYEVLDYYLQYWTALNPGAAQIKVTVSRSKSDEIEATAYTTFGYNESGASYSVAFVVLENGLTALQTNYFSPSYELEYDLPGWSDNDPTVEWTYSDTARDIFDMWGIDESIPTTIKAGETYKFSHAIPMTNVENIDNTVIVALLLDNQTGTILNADRVSASDFSGIENIEGDKYVGPTVGDGVISGLQGARVYNLAGQLVNPGNSQSVNVAPGFYIVKGANHTSKVIVK